MASTRGELLAVACLCAVTLPSLTTAQAARGAQPGGHAEDRLKMVVVLSRHGVRSPTWKQDRLNGYSSLPWPQWSVTPGNLTTRGSELLKPFGSFDRAFFARAGLFDAQGCADGASVYIWADTDQRTQESGRALATGLFPNSTPAVRGLKEGENDSIFHSASDASAADGRKAFAEFETRVAKPPAGDTTELLKQMQRVLWDACLRQIARHSELLKSNCRMRQPLHAAGKAITWSICRDRCPWRRLSRRICCWSTRKACQRSRSDGER